MKALGDAIDAKPSEIKALFRGRLSDGRAQELQKEMLKIGIGGV